MIDLWDEVITLACPTDYQEYQETDREKDYCDWAMEKNKEAADE